MNAVDWVREHWTLEDGSRPVLRPWQMRFLRAAFPEDGSQSQWTTFLLSLPKKTAKTETNAMAIGYAALTLPAPDVLFVAANDAAQAEQRVFDRVARAYRAMGLERSGAVRILKSEIALETGTKIVALPADWAGSAGALFSVSSWTEAWAYVNESAVRMWEELTPIPNRRSLRIVDSYAGFVGDSPVLEPLFERALRGEQVDEDTWASGGLWALIGQGEEARRRYWLGAAEDFAPYYAEQQVSMRASAFLRQHDNTWTSGEEAFLTAEDWDACVVPEVLPLLPGELPHPLFVGVDAATKGDCAAVVAVCRDGARVRLARHRIWTPSKRDPLDLESTVEAFLLKLRDDFPLTQVSYDPYQLARSAATLTGAGLPMAEFPQTSGNLTAAGQNLWDLIRERRLVLYPDAELRQHALNAVAVESSRGWRLAKEKASRKIDGLAALSFAALAAVERVASKVDLRQYAEYELATHVYERGGLRLTSSDPYHYHDRQTTN